MAQPLRFRDKKPARTRPGICLKQIYDLKVASWQRSEALAAAQAQYSRQMLSI